MTVFAASTHPGLKRNNNEDCYAADATLGLWLVADGVGGHASGEVAAAIVRDTITADVAGGGQLANAIGHAHHAVLDEIRNRGSNSNMGSTVVALSLQGDTYDIAWVGDSRAYLFDGELKQLTRDHSPVSDLLANGTITPRQAETHPDRHVLSQSLGVSQSISVRPGCVSGKLQAGQQILLCSDGLTNELNDRAIAGVLQQHDHPDSQVDALVNAALGNGGNDNITVVMVGAPDTTKHEKSAQRPDMEITQDIGDAVRSNRSERRSHDNKVWLILAAIVTGAVIWLLK